MGFAALLLLSVSLANGLSADDYYHRLVLTGGGDLPVLSKNPFDMFRWARGDGAYAQQVMELGLVGWWFDPELVMAYFRPLSVLTHWVDYRLWPDSPWLMHLHSLLWFALALMLAWRVYVRLLEPAALGSRARTVAVLAFVMFALDDAHAIPVGWIANRNALCAFALGVAALLFHDRGVRQRSAVCRRAAPLLLLLALLAGESALAAAGYLLAYGLFLDPRPRRVALRALLPCAFSMGLWACFYRVLGYGVSGSGAVLDPGHQPLRYAAAALQRVPILLGAQFAFPPSDLFDVLEIVSVWLPWAMLLWMLLVLVALGAALWPLLRRHAPARFFALGTLLAAQPLAAQLPSDRLLIFVGFGAMPLLALLITQLLGEEANAPEPAAAAKTEPVRPRLPLAKRALGYGCAVVHLVFAPLWMPVSAQGPRLTERMLAQADRSIAQDASVRDATVLLLNPPFEAYAGYVQTERAALGRPHPRALRVLATGTSDLDVTRLDARTLRIRARDGFLALPPERMLRDPRRPMPLGYRVRFSDCSIEIVELMPDGRPAAIEARFGHPLEDRGYRFLVWEGEGFIPFVLPAIGEQRTLPKIDLGRLLSAPPPQVPEASE